MTLSMGRTAVEDLASVDLTDLGLWSEGPPYELFARMREQAPVRWNHSADGTGFWSLTRGADITEVSSDHRRFSSARGGIFLSPNALAPLEMARDFPIFKDPPEHGRYRDIVAQAFQPRALDYLDVVIDDIVERTLDKVVERGRCDLVADIAVPIPVRVIGRLLGVPEEETDQLLTWTADIERGITYGTPVMETLQQMAVELTKLVDNQVVAGVDSLAKAVTQTDIGGRRLTDTEVATYFAVLLYAGNHPTRDAMSSGMLTLMQHPDQLETLRAEPVRLRASRAGVASVALAEILRWTTPVCYFARTATTNTKLGGVRIKAGDRLVMWYPAANRDSAVIDNPDRFSIQRPSYQFTYYSYGAETSPHHCQGSFLANKMLSSALTGILTRLPDIRQAGHVTRVPSAFANSLTSLPVTFTPTQPVRSGEREELRVAFSIPQNQRKLAEKRAAARGMTVSTMASEVFSRYLADG